VRLERGEGSCARETSLVDRPKMANNGEKELGLLGLIKLERGEARSAGPSG
jgi:hypothetical protein